KSDMSGNLTAKTGHVISKPDRNPAGTYPRFPSWRALRAVLPWLPPPPPGALCAPSCLGFPLPLGALCAPSCLGFHLPLGAQSAPSCLGFHLPLGAQSAPSGARSRCALSAAVLNLQIGFDGMGRDGMGRDG